MEGETAFIVWVEGDQLAISSLLSRRAYHTVAGSQLQLVELVDSIPLCCDVPHRTPEGWVDKAFLLKQGTFIVEHCFIVERKDAFMLSGDQARDCFSTGLR